MAKPGAFTPQGLMDAITAAADEETQRQEKPKRFIYERQLIEQDGPGMTFQMTRQEVKDRLVDWVKDTEVAVAYLESTPGEWNRGTPFAYYRALEVNDD